MEVSENINLVTVRTRVTPSFRVKFHSHQFLQLKLAWAPLKPLTVRVFADQIIAWYTVMVVSTYTCILASKLMFACYVKSVSMKNVP